MVFAAIVCVCVFVCVCVCVCKCLRPFTVKASSVCISSSSVLWSFAAHFYTFALFKILKPF